LLKIEIKVSRVEVKDKIEFYERQFLKERGGEF